MSRNDDYTTGNLLDYFCHKPLIYLYYWYYFCHKPLIYLYYWYYKLIGINLSRQTNTNIPQPINFTGKL